MGRDFENSSIFRRWLWIKRIMTDEGVEKVSLISGNSGTVNIINSTINIISDRDSETGKKTTEPNSTGAKAFVNDQILEKEAGFQDATWLQPDKLVLFHDRPVRSGFDVFYGKQILPGGSQDVAIKLMRHDPHLLNDLQFRLELSHPNIVQLIDVGEYCAFGRWIFVAMELFDKNLRRFVCDLRGNHSELLFTSIFRQLVEAVDFLKRHNIVHEHINPDNIFVTFEGIAKLAHFGIKRDIPQGHCDVTLSSPGVGSDGYGSPEMYNRRAKISFASDIFSLGLVVSFLFSNGRHAFGSDPFNWSYKIRNNKKADLSSVKASNEVKSRQLIQLVKDMLQHKPCDRLTTDQIKEHAFFKEDGVRKSKSLPTLLNLFRNRKDVAPFMPKEISSSEIKMKSLLCAGYYSNFYKGVWKGINVCVEENVNEGSKRYFANKLRALTDLRHLNIVRLIGKTCDDPPCLVLEFVGKENLREYVVRLNKSLTYRERLDISLQIVDGMAFMSERKYIHGNLCAESILVGKDKVVKIGRFRSAQMLHGDNNVEISSFSTRWTAPEGLVSNKFSRMSDVWSFGVVLYEIFSNGAYPYHGIASENVLEHVLSGQRLSKPRECPELVYQKMQDCWQEASNIRPEFGELQLFFQNMQARDHVTGDAKT